MIKLLKKIWFRFFPISRRKALKIAAKALMPDTHNFKVYEKLPGNMNVYMKPNQDEPCWYVIVPPQGESCGMLTTSHLVAISKNTGCVFYKGLAHDEG